MSVFDDEWRKCLQAHYQNVIQRDDKVTLPSLRRVLEKVGFTSDDLKELYVQATLRADALPDGFVPDMSLFEDAPAPTPTLPTPDVPMPTFTAHPTECSCPSCMDDVDEVRHDNDGLPLMGDARQEAEERADFKQKTLF